MPLGRNVVKRRRCLVVLVHSLCLSATALLGLDPFNEVVDDGGPRRLLGPEGHGVVGECELSKLQRLVPHVLVDALLERRSEELFPPVQPWCASTLPLDRGQWRAKEELPELDGLFETGLS